MKRKNGYNMLRMMLTPRFGEIDGMKHVNNNHIGEWFELAREEIYRYFIPDLDLDPEKWKLILVRNETDFLGQIRYGQDVDIRTYILKIGNSSFTVGNEVWQDGDIKAKGRSVIVHYDYLQEKSIRIPDDIRQKLNELFLDEADIGRKL